MTDSGILQSILNGQNKIGADIADIKERVASLERDAVNRNGRLQKVEKSLDDVVRHQLPELQKHRTVVKTSAKTTQVILGVLVAILTLAISVFALT